MPRLIWVFAGHTIIFLVLSCGGSHVEGRIHSIGNEKMRRQTITTHRASCFARNEWRKGIIQLNLEVELQLISRNSYKTLQLVAPSDEHPLRGKEVASSKETTKRSPGSAMIIYKTSIFWITMQTFAGHTAFSCTKVVKCSQMSRDMTKPTKWVCAQRRLRSS